MIIHNKTWLKNLLIQEDAEKECSAGNITAAELEVLKVKYPVGFYTPNVFIRLALFILTIVIVAFSAGLITLALLDSNVLESFGLTLFFGLATYAVLEMLIRSKHHFRSGADDALIWISAGLFLTSVIWFMSDWGPLSGSEEILIAGVMSLLGIFYALRFADLLVAGAGFLSMIAFIFFSWTQGLSFGLATAPFLMMLVSTVSYLLCKITLLKVFAMHYVNCLKTLQVLSLLVFYLSGNYFVLNEIGGKVPLALFFWLWTIFMPLAYVALGLTRKNVMLIRTGLLLIGVAAVTFENYYDLFPIEGLLTAVGALLIVIAYSTMKYLKTPKFGFTAEMLNEQDVMDKLKVESLIVSETLSGNDAPPAEGTTFGGGNFGGGGASGNF